MSDTPTPPAPHAGSQTSATPPPDPAPSTPRPRREGTILGRLAQAVREQNWFAVGLEIVIVVLGVVIGFQITAWGQAQQARQVEIESLRELRTALTNDLVDIQDNVNNHRNAYRSSRLLQAHMSEGRPYSDTLDVHFVNLFTPSFSIRDLAAYETLKQRGMATITNDSLRVAIGHLYGARYEGVLGLQAMTREFVTEQVAPYMSDHFRDLRLFESWTPIDHDDLVADTRFRSLVDQSATYHGFLLGSLEPLEEETVALIADLDAEVARLEGAP